MLARAQGTVRSGGRAAVAIPRAAVDALRSPLPGGSRSPLAEDDDENLFVHYTGSKPVPGTATAWVSTASVGMSPSLAKPGKALVLTASASVLADIEVNPGPPTLTTPTIHPANPAPQMPFGEAADEAPVPLEAPIMGTGKNPTPPPTVPGPPTKPRPNNATLKLAGVPPVRAVVGDACYFNNGAYTCQYLESTRNFTAQAYRGLSSKGPMTRSSFRVLNGMVQEWENGTRTREGGTWGPFTIEGTTSRELRQANGVEAADTWPLRGECWAGVDRSVNATNCNMGTQENPIMGTHPSHGQRHSLLGRGGTDGRRRLGRHPHRGLRHLGVGAVPRLGPAALGIQLRLQHRENPQHWLHRRHAVARRYGLQLRLRPTELLPEALGD